MLACAHFSLFAQINLETTVLQENVVLQNLEVPWDMTWNDGWIWFTELEGDISRFNPDTEELQFIDTVNDVHTFGFSAGMHSIVLHPDFQNQPLVFVHYTSSQEVSKIVRFDYNDTSNTLENPYELPVNITGGPSHNGSRMLIIENVLYISIGDTYSDPDTAQDMNSNNGKVLRINLDGTIPSDNPDPTSYIWTSGHRNPQGLCIGNDKIYSSEHGTFIDDEINIIEANRNYGWPEVEGACDLNSEEEFCEAENVAEPIYAWTPAIAPSGLDFYGNETLIPEWNNSLLVATLKNRELVQLKLNSEGTEVTEVNTYLTGEYGRLRDVLVVPDGRIYICTSNHDYAGNPSPNDDLIIELKPEIIDQIPNLSNDTRKLITYPNPVTDGVVKYKFEFGIPELIQIVDITGKVMITKLGNNLGAIDVNHLNKGYYILSIFSNGTTYQNSFITN